MILPLREKDRIQMKKNHPCGGDVFLVLRVGSDIRVKCEKCGRDMVLPREKLEAHVKKILPKGGETL